MADKQPVPPAEHEPAVNKIAAGYDFDQPSVEFGVLADSTGEALPEVKIAFPLSTLNRHGLVCGATGTGKTVTLQVLAQRLSKAGVPVFVSDVKGDLSGMTEPGEPSDKLAARTKRNGQDWQPQAAPVEFFALGGQGDGIPIRATVTSFGPLLLAKVLGLNQTQESSLGLIFHFADQNGLPLLDLKDLSALLKYLTSDEGKPELKEIGGIASSTAGVILREVINLSAQGGDAFFGEPEIDVADLIRYTEDGRGVVSMLELPNLQDRPRIFSTFMMWLLAELFSQLPEVGDVDKPKLVFFFDEAHLLFKDASDAFLDQVTQTVRLIRSKGVGVFFVTQLPSDVPQDVLAQLGSRIQHQMRAHTPKDQKVIRETVGTFPNNDYDLEQVLAELGTGQAVVTGLNLDGRPTPLAWTRIWAPESKMGPSSEVANLVAASQLLEKYAEPIDRESAHELLAKKLERGAAEAEPGDSEAESGNSEAKPAGARTNKTTKSTFDKIMNSSAMKQFGRTAAREIARSIFGTSRRRR